MKSSGRILRHNGIIRTREGERYVERSLESSLADPALQPHCQWGGNLFPELTGKAPTVAAVEAIFRNRHPVTDDPLKRTVNLGTRRQGDKEVSNVCRGFTATLGAPKQVSIAALFFADKTVFDVATTCLAKALDPLTGKIDRRQPRPRQHQTIPTGLGMHLKVLEAVNRRGAPHLHFDDTFMNVTGYDDNGRRRHCAAHFRRLIKSVSPAWRRAYRMMYRELKRKGYVVHGTAEKWQLGGVPDWLSKHWSTAMTGTSLPNPEALSRVDLLRQAKSRDQLHKRTRPKKTFRPLAAWQDAWRAELGPDQSNILRQIYQAVHAGQMLRTAHKSSQNPPHAINHRIDPDPHSVLQPVPKATLLAAVGVNRQHLPPLRSCAEVVDFSQQLLQRGISTGNVTPKTRRRIYINADIHAYPWVQTAVSVLELSFPTVRFAVRHRAQTRPELRKQVTNKEASDLQLVTSANHLLSEMAKMPPPECTRLGQLMDQAGANLRPAHRTPASTGKQLRAPSTVPSPMPVDMLP